jgi:hypothetical protein
MPKRKASKFSFYQCPNCEALYQRVRRRVGQGDDPQISCNACSAPLPTREGEFALKYFMLREAARAQVRGTLTRFET